MQAFNHVAFGSLVAVTVKEPALALPIAFASHFLLDSIPHYGEDKRTKSGSRLFYIRLLIDGLISVSILAIFLSYQPPSPLLLISCAILAVSPDFLWPLALHVKKTGLLWKFFVFHKTIQTESPKGIYLEIVWFFIVSFLVILKLN